MARQDRSPQLTGWASLAFLVVSVDLLGQIKEITQLMCKDLGAQVRVVL